MTSPKARLALCRALRCPCGGAVKLREAHYHCLRCKVAHASLAALVTGEWRRDGALHPHREALRRRKGAAARPTAQGTSLLAGDAPGVE